MQSSFYGDMTMASKNTILSLAIGAALVAGSAFAPAAQADDHGPIDFGAKVQHMLADKSDALFGIKAPLAAAASAVNYVPRELANGNQRLMPAKGLNVQIVTRSMAQWGDQIAFWPNANSYSHLIVCIEQRRTGTTPAGNDGLNASVQRINVNTGAVETILHGMNVCDGIRTTPWGTVLATEEDWTYSAGRAYEILDPMNTTDEWVADRNSGDIRTAIDSAAASTHIVQRTTLPTANWEGIVILPSGVVYSGDELRPGTGVLDSDGGAIFKFIPDVPNTATSISDLADSPLAAGSVYAMSVSCKESTSSKFPQYGQGCQIGQSAWVKIDALNARIDSDTKGATGYYRPEDFDQDPLYTGPGVRFCYTATGREKAKSYSEVLCLVDDNPLPASPISVVDGRTGLEYLGDDATGQMTVATVNRLVEGDPRFNSSDNLAFQAGTGNLYVVEDHKYGEIWACLPDGADRDIKTDGCISTLSVVDPNAEPTGFIFDGTGQVAFVDIQHGEEPASLLDWNSNPVNGYTDDLLMITGFELDD